MLNFTRAGMGQIEVEPLPGTLKTGGVYESKPDAIAPPVRASFASEGSCEAAIDKLTFNLAKAIALASPPGPGATDVSGDAAASDALVDVLIHGKDGILCAAISWKGAMEAGQ